MLEQIEPQQQIEQPLSGWFLMDKLLLILMPELMVETIVALSAVLPMAATVVAMILPKAAM